jgi:hypothetical protein
MGMDFTASDAGNEFLHTKAACLCPRGVHKELILDPTRERLHSHSLKLSHNGDPLFPLKRVGYGFIGKGL